jgi:hypothetical protein
MASKVCESNGGKDPNILIIPIKQSTDVTLRFCLRYLRERVWIGWIGTCVSPLTRTHQVRASNPDQRLATLAEVFRITIIIIIITINTGHRTLSSARK